MAATDATLSANNAGYTRIAVVGTGGYGGSILKALLHSKAFTSIRAVTREPTDDIAGKEMRLRELQSLGAQVITYDSTTASAFASAFAETDIVISAVGFSAISSQFAMVDGAIQAGVKWFLPSEFGVAHGSSTWLPFDGPLAAKRDVLAYLKERQSQIAYTAIYTGLALDYLDPRVLGLKLTRRSATLVGRGGTPMSCTNQQDTIRVIVEVAKRPREMQNRAIRFAGSTTRMRELIKTVTANECGNNVKLVSIDEAKEKFCELAKKQDMRAFEIYCRLLVEEGLTQIDRKGEKLDNHLFSFKPEPVQETLERLLLQAETVGLGIHGPTVHRSETGGSVTEGIGRAADTVCGTAATAE
ncbi:hypothetical protein FBU59_002265 [Linderina macrospora]|uniref:Uncharacterized protein n=1 Tax=Linderina macrospora TaxID=4868 RepID=A0ACC1JBM7_9FUNG|nr:hypothetical protein FBU59_002265 [Linderina macrospora]